MRKVLVLLMALVCMNCAAQKALSYSIVIQKEGADAQTLYDLTRSWLSEYYHDSKTVLQNQTQGKELSGRGAALLNIGSLSYSGMSGLVEYFFDIQFREGRLKLTMSDFYHKPERKVMYDNYMGQVLDTLPEDLKSLGGRFEKASFRNYYKHFYKYAKPVCDKAFTDMANSLKDFIDKREAVKDDW